MIGPPDPSDPVGPFHDAWRLMAVAGLTAGALALALGRVHARDPEAVAAAVPEGGGVPAPAVAIARR